MLTKSFSLPVIQNIPTCSKSYPTLGNPTIPHLRFVPIRPRIMGFVGPASAPFFFGGIFRFSKVQSLFPSEQYLKDIQCYDDILSANVASVKCFNRYHHILNCKKAIEISARFKSSSFFLRIRATCST